MIFGFEVSEIYDLRFMEFDGFVGKKSRFFYGVDEDNDEGDEDEKEKKMNKDKIKG